jgi:DNA-binding PadR family transcriptional regulator
VLSTKHVVLGLLLERPGYGYDLQQRMDDRFSFLQLSETAIYRLLDTLERDGYIAESGEKVIGGTRRGSPRVTYAPTDTGTVEFHKWMTMPCSSTVLRESLHAKLVLSSTDDLPSLIEQVVQQERETWAELARFQRPAPHELNSGEVPWGTVAAMLVDDAHARRLQATIGWLQQVRAVLQRRLAEHQRAATEPPTP